MPKISKSQSNKYFQKTPYEKRQFQLRLGLLALMLNLTFGGLLIIIHSYFIPVTALMLAFTLSIIAPFYDVPSLIKRGNLKYHSLFLLAEKERKGIIKIHGGTLFDYYFSLDRHLSGKQRTNLIISEYLKGLLDLAGKTEDHIIVKGTSYIINERTAEKIGLQKVKTDPVQTFILVFNYFNLLASISLARKQLSFPNISNIKTYQGTVKDIKSKEAFIKKLII